MPSPMVMRNIGANRLIFRAIPDLVSKFPTLCARPFFWVVNNCWDAADGGIGDSVVDRVTKIVNPGEISNP